MIFQKGLFLFGGHLLPFGPPLAIARASRGSAGFWAHAETEPRRMMLVMICSVMLNFMTIVVWISKTTEETALPMQSCIENMVIVS